MDDSFIGCMRVLKRFNNLHAVLTGAPIQPSDNLYVRNLLLTWTDQVCHATQCQSYCSMLKRFIIIFIEPGSGELYVQNSSYRVVCGLLQDIMGVFQTYGSVREIRILPGPAGSGGQGSGGALVRMGSPEEAAQAMAGVNAWAASTGTSNGTFPLSVKYADTAEEKAR